MHLSNLQSRGAVLQMATSGGGKAGPTPDSLNQNLSTRGRTRSGKLGSFIEEIKLIRNPRIKIVMELLARKPKM